MALLKAPVAYLEPLTADVRSGFGPLGELLVAIAPEIRQDKCESIKDEMKDSPLSSWFSLFTRTIFRYVYESDDQYRTLLNTVAGLSPAGAAGLADLRERAVRSGISKQLETLRLQQRALMTTSFFTSPNGQTLLERDAEITAAIVALEAQINPMLALFLIVEKIIIILQDLERLGNAGTRIKEKNPILFIADLIPTFRLLQNGEERDLEEVIRLTLQLVDIRDDRLASNIKKTLLKRHWLEVVVPEEEQGNCLTRAFRHLFFRQRRRRVSPHDGLPEAEGASHTDEAQEMGLVNDMNLTPDAFVEIEEEDEAEVFVHKTRSSRTKMWHMKMGVKFEKLPEINEEHEPAMAQVP
jgi:hypothetical protein